MLIMLSFEFGKLGYQVSYGFHITSEARIHMLLIQKYIYIYG